MIKNTNKASDFTPNFHIFTFRKNLSGFTAVWGNCVFNLSEIYYIIVES